MLRLDKRRAEIKTKSETCAGAWALHMDAQEGRKKERQRKKDEEKDLLIRAPWCAASSTPSSQSPPPPLPQSSSTSANSHKPQQLPIPLPNTNKPNRTKPNHIAQTPHDSFTHAPTHARKHIHASHKNRKEARHRRGERPTHVRRMYKAWPSFGPKWFKYTRHQTLALTPHKPNPTPTAWEKTGKILRVEM